MPNFHRKKKDEEDGLSANGHEKPPSPVSVPSSNSGSGNGTLAPPPENGVVSSGAAEEDEEEEEEVPQMNVTATIVRLVSLLVDCCILTVYTRC